MCIAASRGSAMMVAVALLMLVSAIGLGLVLTTSLEPAMAAASESSLVALYGAEAGVSVAAVELADIADWNTVLAGMRRSSTFDANPDGGLTLPDGTAADLRAFTNTLTCGHAETCTGSEMDAFSTARPWGPNNPRWQLFGAARLDGLLADEAGIAPCAIVIWVADDPAEIDGNPLRDMGLLPNGSPGPGSGLLLVRADGFAARSAHRTVLATVARPRWNGDPRRSVVAWRELR